MHIDQAVALRTRALTQMVSTCADSIEQVVSLVTATLTAGHTVFFMGNGGSAADAQHLAAEFVGRFVEERRALPALALTVDSSILTAVANDYGYQAVFARQVEALVRPGDVVIGISTSGLSANVLAGLTAARGRGAVPVGLTGANGGAMALVCDVLVRVPSDVTAVIQELHTVVGHLICEAVDEELSR